MHFYNALPTRFIRILGQHSQSLGPFELTHNIRDLISQNLGCHPYHISFIQYESFLKSLSKKLKTFCGLSESETVLTSFPKTVMTQHPNTLQIGKGSKDFAMESKSYCDSYSVR
ncbi:Hypothetical predicted protein [Octopus vulgaris]|uniref:Uncharacterized protein n=1 Tax=Octopus vulgaris TaxID=6645 RepID=A0AA36BF05_OCTVU|nr:Hypothetical predicted protein [Octopus vulgaris]